MQINVHIPRSMIREAKRKHAFDPFNEAATAFIGVPVYVGFEKVYIHGTPDVIADTPRSAKRALKKYIAGTLDAPVRFRITIPEEKVNS